MLNLIKKITLFAFSLILISSFSYGQDDMKMNMSGDQPVGIKMADGILYGKDYDPSMALIEFPELIKSANDYNNKVVLVKGNVSEVCQAMGCWVVLSDGTNEARATTLHKFFLPKDIAGQNAVVIGKFKITEISEDQAKEYNEETKNPKVKTDDIKGPQKVYEIDAMGIKILNPDSSKPDSKPDSNSDKN